MHTADKNTTLSEMVTRSVIKDHTSSVPAETVSQPQLSANEKCSRGWVANKKKEKDTTSKILKHSVSSTRNSTIIDKYLKRKDERDALQYNVTKAKRTLKKDSQLLEQHNEATRRSLNRDLAIIEIEKLRWEAMWDHELVVTKQRVHGLEEKKENLRAFGEVLDWYRKERDSEGEVLRTWRRASLSHEREPSFLLINGLFHHGLNIVDRHEKFYMLLEVSGTNIARNYSDSQNREHRAHRLSRRIDPAKVFESSPKLTHAVFLRLLT